MKRRNNPFRGVNTVEDRHGKQRHRPRRIIRGRIIDCYLPGPTAHRSSGRFAPIPCSSSAPTIPVNAGIRFNHSVAHEWVTYA